MGNSGSPRSSPSTNPVDSDRPQNSLFHVAPPDIAIVDVTIQPDIGGRVRYQGSFWSAKSFQNKGILEGQYVKVLDRDNLTLVVKEIQISNS